MEDILCIRGHRWLEFNASSLEGTFLPFRFVSCMNQESIKIRKNDE